MKLKSLFCGEKYSISGNLYTLASVFSYGSGLLRGVRCYVFQPIDKNLSILRATQWHDGEILRISRY